jgi:hypothetical protein
MSNKELINLTKFAFNISHKMNWSFNASQSFLEICDFEDGEILNLIESEEYVKSFLRSFFSKCLNVEGSYLDKIEKNQIKSILEKNLESVDECINREKIENLIYNEYTKKLSKLNGEMKFSEYYESERINRLKNSFEPTYDILKKINSKIIDLDDKNVWDSLVNGVNYLSEIWEMNPNQCVKKLIMEYENDSKSAYTIILGMSKDASRQNLSEELQREVWLSNDVILQRLPQTGDDSLHIYNDKWVRGKELTTDTKGIATKAMDFKIINSNGEVYTYNKYNKWVGGSTDDVYNDIKKTIESFNKIMDNTIKLLIILDGKYWDDGKRNELSIYKNNLLMITCSDKSGDESVKNFIF